MTAKRTIASFGEVWVGTFETNEATPRTVIVVHDYEHVIGLELVHGQKFSLSEPEGDDIEDLHNAAILAILDY
jgi:hypothetical protein